MWLTWGGVWLQSGSSAKWTTAVVNKVSEQTKWKDTAFWWGERERDRYQLSTPKCLFKHYGPFLSNPERCKCAKGPVSPKPSRTKRERNKSLLWTLIISSKKQPLRRPIKTLQFLPLPMTDQASTLVQKIREGYLTKTTFVKRPFLNFTEHGEEFNPLPHTGSGQCNANVSSDIRAKEF